MALVSLSTQEHMDSLTSLTAYMFVSSMTKLSDARIAITRQLPGHIVQLVWVRVHVCLYIRVQVLTPSPVNPVLHWQIEPLHWPSGWHGGLHPVV